MSSWFRSRRGSRACTCGHEVAAHEHYRRGTDCALCDCMKFRAGAAAGPQETVDTVDEVPEFRRELVRVI